MGRAPGGGRGGRRARRRRGGGRRRAAARHGLPRRGRPRRPPRPALERHPVRRRGPRPRRGARRRGGGEGRLGRGRRAGAGGVVHRDQAPLAGRARARARARHRGGVPAPRLADLAAVRQHPASPTWPPTAATRAAPATSPRCRGTTAPTCSSAPSATCPTLPRVLGPHDPAGHLPSGGAVLGPGAGDNAAAALGLGAGEGDVVVSIGTSGVVSAVTSTPVADVSGTVAGFADATGRHLPLIAHAQRRPGPRRRRPACSASTTRRLSRLALEAPPGADGLVLVPYLEGERTPDRPEATGSLHGLTLATARPPTLARAFVEGVFLGLADGLDAVVAHGRATGAGAARRRCGRLRGGARGGAVGARRSPSTSRSPGSTSRTAPAARPPGCSTAAPSRPGGRSARPVATTPSRSPGCASAYARARELHLDRHALIAHFVQPIGQSGENSVALVPHLASHVRLDGSCASLLSLTGEPN